MTRLLLLLIPLLITSLNAVAAGNDIIMHFTFNEATGSNFIVEEVRDVQFPVSNLFNSAERIPAVMGKALRLDGYSTYAQENYPINQVNKKMTIEAWYATEAFSPSTNPARRPIEGGALVSQITDGAGFALEVGSYGNVSLNFYADGKKYVVTTPQKIEKYVWNHIVATVDLDAKEARIYVNGNLWKTMQLEAQSSLTFADVPMFIGRHNTTELIEGFNITTLNGAIDDLKVLNSALTESEIVTRYEAIAPQAVTGAIFEGFEAADYGSWTVIGNAFGTQPASGSLEGQLPVEGFRGTHLVNSFHGGDPAQGKISSPDFTINSGLIKLLVGGGNHPGKAEVRLRINGEIVKTATGNNSETLSERTWDVSEFIGATAQIEIVDSVTGGWGHILADNIIFTDQQQLLPADLFIDPTIRHAGDYLRPRYHAMPNTSWTNESYGLIYYKGKYHLFFQKNPNGLWLHFMHWGHLSSPDLVHWQEEKIALAPSPGFDDFGVWSGTTIKDNNGEPVIFYTGVDLAKAGIGVAFPKDDNLIEWEKYAKNPVIPSVPAGFLDFRDPFLWKDNDTYYMIVGAGLANNGGGALPTYKSTDLLNWTRITSLHSSPDLEASGFFWEMPLFFPLNDQGDYLLAITPLYGNKPANVVYWIGKWENERFKPYFKTPKLFEPVRDNLLAPAIGTDEEGRITYLGIIPETRNVRDQLQAGWRHVFSLPRVLRKLQDSTIGHYPHPNLCRLRTNEVEVQDRVIRKGSNKNLPEFDGNQLNLSFKIKADSASRFSLQVLKNDNGTQFTSFIFDLEKNLVALDTRFAHAKEAAKEYTASEYIFDFNEEINLEVFIDHSIVEVFIDNLLVLSTRAYPAETSRNVDLVVSQGKIEVQEAKQWTIQDMGSATGMEACEPAFLPTEFRSPPQDPPVTGLKKNDEIRRSIKLYPNPAAEYLQIQLPDHLTAIELSVLTLGGLLVRSEKVGESKQHYLNTSGLTEGIYLLNIRGRNFSEYYKVIIQQK